jgi:hypothetical protein
MVGCHGHVRIGRVDVAVETAPRPMGRKSLARRTAAATAVVVTDVGRGMAFVIDERGYLLTNRHVVEDAEQIEKVVFPALDPPVVARSVQVVWTDPARDLALLRVITERPLPIVPLATAKEIEPGRYLRAAEQVMLLERRAEGEQTTGLIAHVGALGELDIRNPAVGPGTYLAVRAPVRRGQSGGPVVDRHGAVVGIVTWILRDKPGGFAIPIAEATAMLREIPRFDDLDDHRARVELRARAFVDALEHGEFEAMQRLIAPSRARQTRTRAVELMMSRISGQPFDMLIDALDHVVARAEAPDEALTATFDLAKGLTTPESIGLLGLEGQLGEGAVFTFFAQFGRAYVAARAFGGESREAAIESALRYVHSLDVARAFTLVDTLETLGGEGLGIASVDVSPGAYAPRAVVMLSDDEPAGAGRTRPRRLMQLRFEWGDWFVDEIHYVDAKLPPRPAPGDGLREDLPAGEGVAARETTAASGGRGLDDALTRPASGAAAALPRR